MGKILTSKNKLHSMKTKFDTPPDFNWRDYLELNPDVKKNGYVNEKLACEHWYRWGKKEGRSYRKDMVKQEPIEIQKTTIDLPLENKTDLSFPTGEVSKPKEGEKDLTIIIPNKKGQTPKITINSLYKQTLQNFDIIIINDNEGNANKARNEGLKKVKTPFVLFSDNDIEWKPTAIFDLYNCLKKNPDVSFSYGSYQSNNGISSNVEWDVKRLKRGNYISTMSMVKTEDHPGFDESIKRFQDWDVWLTMVENGKKGKSVGKLIFSTTIRPDGITFGSIPTNEAVKIIRDKHDKKKDLDNPQLLIDNGLFFNDKKVLVIIPAYNAEATILESIDSIKKQTYVNIEIVVVDDCSTDNTYNILRNTDGIKLYKTKENVGTYRAINHALYLSYGFDYFMIHGADDVMYSNKIEEHIRPLIYNSYLASISDYIRVDKNDNFLSHIANGHSMVLYSREVFEKIGYFDNTRFGGDTEYLKRFKIAFNTNQLATINKTLMKAYTGDNNLTKKVKIGGNDRQQYVKKFTNEHIKMNEQKLFIRFDNNNIDYDYHQKILLNNHSNIEMSVALPVYNGSKIVWIALESLCKQQNIQFSWELLICEENQNNFLPVDFFYKYGKKLKKAGCSIIKFIKPYNRISLAKKWQIIGQNIDDNSKCFVLQAADCYSPSHRLSLTYDYIVNKNYDWVDFSKGYFYSTISKKLFLYNYNGKTNLNMAFKSTYSKNIPNTDLTKGIDNFLYEHCNNNTDNFTVYHNEELFEDSLDIHGYNNISISREEFFNTKPHIFHSLDKNINNLNINDDILIKIKDL